MAEIKHKEYFHSISQMVMKQSKNSLDELYKLQNSHKFHTRLCTHGSLAHYIMLYYVKVKGR